MRTAAACTFLVALLFTPGCLFGALPGSASAQHLTIEASREELLQAALQHADEQEGWTISKSTQSKVVAVTEVDDSGGMVTREKWLFRARDGVVTARLLLEFKDGKKWDSIDLVSQNYSYFREHEHLRQISERTIKNRIHASR